MILSDLSLTDRANSEDIKAALEEKLASVLPAGSFTVILRSYQGDFRSRNTNKASYSAMIMLDPNGKKAALGQKEKIEEMGFKVSGRGDISAN